MAALQYLQAFAARFVSVHADEIPTLFHACSSFFFILSAYFMVIPFRDEAAISLGTDKLPLLFIASLLLTLIAAPVSSYFLSLPFQSKSKALFIMYRFFGASLVIFYMLYCAESTTSLEGYFSSTMQKLKLGAKREPSHWIFVGLRVCFYIWIALLNLFTTSALWARLSDIMNSEAGSRLFGFVGAGATLGQLAGSILAVVFSSFGPFLLLLSAAFLEFGARCALGIGPNGLFCGSTSSRNSDDMCTSESDSQKISEVVQSESYSQRTVCSKISALLEGLHLILASSYLLHICCLLWLTAVVSSFFYFQRANVVAGVVHDSLGRRRLLAKINSFTAVFILLGQLTITGRLLTFGGITIALCASPIMAIISMATISLWPTPLVIAISEASRKVMTYVVTKPGREVLFTVTSREEKYKAKVFIDTFVQRLGDAAAAGIYEVIGSLLLLEPSSVAICALPVCFGWLLTALTLAHRQQALAKSVPDVSNY